MNDKSSGDARFWFYPLEMCTIMLSARIACLLVACLRPFLIEPEHIHPNKHNKQPLILN